MGSEKVITTNYFFKTQRKSVKKHWLIKICL